MSSAVAKAWVNPAHGTAASRAVLRRAASEAESSIFARAKPKPTLRTPKPKVYDLSKKLTFRAAKKVAQPILRTGVTRMGTVGVEFEHQGVKGWGVNETAARASWQQNHANRFANGVSKGIARQSVKPLLARRAQLAATAARPVRTNARAIIGKGAMGDALKAVKTGRSVAEAGWKAGRTGAKPKMSLGTLTAASKSPALQRIGQGAQMAGANPVVTGLVGGSILGGGLVHERNINKALSRGQLDRLYRVEAQRGRRLAGTQQESVRDTAYRQFQTLLARRDGAVPRAARKRGKTETSLWNQMGAKNRESRFADLQGQRSRILKAYGDPEDARYYRLGAGSAALGAGGLAAAGAGGRRIIRDTKELRELRNVGPGRAPKFQRGSWKGANGKIRAAKPQERLGEEMAHDVRTKNWMTRAQRLEQAKTHARSGAVIHSRPAALVGGGLAALGGAEALRRRASERRWN